MILPSEATPCRWSPHHQRLHRHLLRRPELLPPGAPLLLAVSGGQDSMALAALLTDLRRLHGWRLQLWHGDHGWRPESGAQAEELAAWAAAAGLPLELERAIPAPSGEEAARLWRYGCLDRSAAALGCGHVVTGHTASDRAETVLLNLARGSHLRGLCSLRARRPLGKTATPAASDEPAATEGPAATERPMLVRPLLPFSRDDTARICRELGVPVWQDASNGDGRYQRNRVRSEVMPVLEALHPGAGRRIAAQAERLEGELEAREQLLSLALESLRAPGDPEGHSLARRSLGRLEPANRRQLLEHWLRHLQMPALDSATLEELGRRLEPERGAGAQDLAGGWRLRWDRSTLCLQRSGDARHGDG